MARKKRKTPPTYSAEVTLIEKTDHTGKPISVEVEGKVKRRGKLVTFIVDEGSVNDKMGTLRRTLRALAETLS